MPAGTPIMNDKNSPTAASCMVAGMRSIRRWRASFWLRTDLPKSPLVRRFFMKSKYWTMKGLLRPSCSLSSSYTSSEASILTGSRRRAGSPVMWTAENTTKLRPSRVTMASRTFLMAYRVISQFSVLGWPRPSRWIPAFAGMTGWGWFGIRWFIKRIANPPPSVHSCLRRNDGRGWDWRVACSLPAVARDG